MFYFAVVCILYAANLSWNSLQFADASRAALKWPAVEGVIRVHYSRRSVTREYVYSISGNQYRGSLFELPSPIPYYGSSARYNFKDGHRLLVYFDPLHPERSCVNRNLNEDMLKNNLVYAGLAAFFGILAIGSFWSNRTDSKAAMGFR